MRRINDMNDYFQARKNGGGGALGVEKIKILIKAGPKKFGKGGALEKSPAEMKI